MLSHLASTTAPTGAERVLDSWPVSSAVGAIRSPCRLRAGGTWSRFWRRAGVEVRSIPIRWCWLVQADRQPLWRQVVRGARFLAARPRRSRLPGVLHRFRSRCRPRQLPAASSRRGGGARMRSPGGLARARDPSAGASPSVVRRPSAAGRDADRGGERGGGGVAPGGRVGDLVEVVHNGVEAPVGMPDRAAARETFELPADACVVGLFSQLVEHKGALDFVRAAHRSASEDPRLWFLIAGHGPAGFVERLRGRDRRWAGRRSNPAGAAATRDLAVAGGGGCGGDHDLVARPACRGW